MDIVFMETGNKLLRRKQRGIQSENYDRPKGRGINPSSAAGGLKYVIHYLLPSFRNLLLFR